MPNTLMTLRWPPGLALSWGVATEHEPPMDARLRGQDPGSRPAADVYADALEGCRHATAAAKLRVGGGIDVARERYTQTKRRCTAAVHTVRRLTLGEPKPAPRLARQFVFNCDEASLRQQFTALGALHILLQQKLDQHRQIHAQAQATLPGIYQRLSGAAARAVGPVAIGLIVGVIVYAGLFTSLCFGVLAFVGARLLLRDPDPMLPGMQAPPVPAQHILRLRVLEPTAPAPAVASTPPAAPAPPPASAASAGRPGPVPAPVDPGPHLPDAKRAVARPRIEVARAERICTILAGEVAYQQELLATRPGDYLLFAALQGRWTEAADTAEARLAASQAKLDQLRTAAALPRYGMAANAFTGMASAAYFFNLPLRSLVRVPLAMTAGVASVFSGRYASALTLNRWILTLNADTQRAADAVALYSGDAEIYRYLRFELEQSAEGLQATQIV